MDVLRRAAALAEEHLAGIGDRRAASSLSYEDAVAALDEPLPEHGEDPVAVIERLAAVAGPATVASPAPRYFGFVTGGALPAALAADWLVAPGTRTPARVSSPAAAAVEDGRRALGAGGSGLPLDAAVGFTTGATMANFTGLAAARHAVLARAGWDVEADGLNGAPAVARRRRRAGPRVAAVGAAHARVRRASGRSASPPTNRARCAPTRSRPRRREARRSSARRPAR